MQFVGALLQPRLHLAQLIQPLLLGGGGQRDRRLFIRLGRGVELLRQLLDLLLEAQHFFVEGRLRRGVAGRALQNLARGHESELERTGRDRRPRGGGGGRAPAPPVRVRVLAPDSATERKSTRLNSSHRRNSYAVLCLEKKNKEIPGGH